MKKLFKTMLKICAVALPLLLIAGWLAFWPLMAAVMERRSAAAEIRLTHVAGSVYQVDAELGGRQIGSSLAASVGPDGVLLVDTPVTLTLARKVRQALDDLGAGAARYVVNTHPHPDHVRGNSLFVETATVIAHSNTRARMATKTRPFRWLPSVAPAAENAQPTETVDGARSIVFNGEEVRLLHFGPGHTDGDLIVVFTGSHVAHVGDLFHGRGGHTASDFANAGGNAEGLVRSLGELIRVLPADVRIVGGHGGVGQVARRQDLEIYHEMSGEVLEYVKRGIAEGWSLEQVVEQGVPDRWRHWFDSARGDSVMHGSAEGWFSNLYRSLTAATE